MKDFLQNSYKDEHQLKKYIKIHSQLVAWATAQQIDDKTTKFIKLHYYTTKVLI